VNWAIKYRPQFLKDVIGNSKAVYLLQRYIKRGDLPKALLFYGKSGCGKTTLAGVLANEIEAVLYEFNTANTRGIDTVRSIVEMCKYRELTGRKRVIVFDECHQLTVDAQNALLKVLEGEDTFNVFVLCTTDKDKLLETIINRCVAMEVLALSYDECCKLVERIEKAENVSYSEDVVAWVWKKNKGVVRNILNDLQSVVEFANDLKKVKKYLKKVDIVDKHDMVEFCSELVRKNLNWAVIAKYLGELADDDVQKFIAFGKSYISSAIVSMNSDRDLRYYADLLKVFVVANSKPDLVYYLADLVSRYKE
jgi:DNA polymerase-3 subunit gamma/tau